MRTIAKISVAVTGASLSSIVAVVPAQANQSWNISGELNTSGTLMQYSTWRPHSAGPSDFTISDQVGCSGNRWGLRLDQSSSQYTEIRSSRPSSSRTTCCPARPMQPNYTLVTLS